MRITQYFAASRDGSEWWRPSRRRPCVPLSPLGDYGSGSIYAMRMMVEEGDHMHLYYCGLQNEQNTLYDTQSGCHPFSGAIMRSTWRTGRFFAAVPSRGGKSQAQLLSQTQHNAADKSLVLNACAFDDGQVTAELLHPDGQPIPGYTHDDCHPLQGDHTQAALRWQSGDVCPVDDVCVRLHFNRARVYGFTWR